TVRIWDTQTGEQVGQPLQGHTAPVTSVAYSPDGRHVVSGSWDHTVRIWDTQSGGHIGDHQKITYAHSPNNHFCFINPQGWLCYSDETSPDPFLILWIPPAFRQGFSDSRQILTIPADGLNFAVQVDWADFAYGSKWTQIWNEEGH
ncbi:hypothetical protein K435DRAFT_753098, partial [Dendrothele bispora CBS 962.96]